MHTSSIHFSLPPLWNIFHNLLLLSLINIYPSLTLWPFRVARRRSSSAAFATRLQISIPPPFPRLQLIIDCAEAFKLCCIEKCCLPAEEMYRSRVDGGALTLGVTCRVTPPRARRGITGGQQRATTGKRGPKVQTAQIYSSLPCNSVALKPTTLQGRYYPFQCWGHFRPKHKDAKIFESHLNLVMFVLIVKLSLSTLRWVPICQGFSHFSVFFCIISVIIWPN